VTNAPIEADDGAMLSPHLQRRMGIWFESNVHRRYSTTTSPIHLSIKSAISSLFFSIAIV